ncbi:unnamed protein product [Closterium sp. NIES-64]|nr:unnamed protein product [Closterium sp. NIES-64]
MCTRPQEMGEASGREPFCSVGSCTPWGAALRGELSLRGELLSVGSCSPWGAALRGELLSVGSCSPWGAALRGSCSPWELLSVGAALRSELLSVGRCSALRGEVLSVGRLLSVGRKGLGVTWDVPLYGELLNAALSSFLSPLCHAALLCLCCALLCCALLCSALLCCAGSCSQKGLGVTWDVPLYGELLKIGGGKERMTHYFNQVGWPQAAPIDPSERAAFVAGLHKSKTALFMQLSKTALFMQLVETGALPLRPGVCTTALFMQLVETGVLPLRPGVARKTALFLQLVETGAVPLRPGIAHVQVAVCRWQRAAHSANELGQWGEAGGGDPELIDEALAAGVRVAVCSTSNEKAVGAIALAAGVRVAVCSTSNEKAVGAIVRVMLGEERAQHMRIFAGDVVPKKKPDPERAQHMRIFAGDVVPKKKPDPAIYNLAATTLSLNPARYVPSLHTHALSASCSFSIVSLCCGTEEAGDMPLFTPLLAAVCHRGHSHPEDSHIGLTAAKAAGMTCVVTKSGYTADEDFSAMRCLTPLVTHMTRTLYTEDEDFSAADAVFDAIGDTPADGFDLPFLASLL